MDGGGDEDDEVEEIGEGVYDASQNINCRRTKSYTQFEDEILIKAWQEVSIDSVSGNDQTGKKYWQRIEDKFFRMMAKNPSRTPRTYRSLQGRWDIIRVTCTRWVGCLDQVRNAPLSGTVEAN